MYPRRQPVEPFNQMLLALQKPQTCSNVASASPFPQVGNAFFTPARLGSLATRIHACCAAETVYGLGANALDESAVLSVFAYKGRPLTDPLIVHTPNATAAGRYLQFHPREKAAFDVLARAFWPGPLTMVVRAAPEIPMKGMPSTRCHNPFHPRFCV